MYSFEEDLVDRAIMHYTMVDGYGFDDEDFYEEMWYRCYGDRVLEISVVLTYLDSLVPEPDKTYYNQWFQRFKVPKPS